MWLKNLSIIAVVLIVATLFAAWRMHHNKKIAARDYIGRHHRDPGALYEKRYDLKLAEAALGRLFEMPVHYVHS